MLYQFWIAYLTITRREILRFTRITREVVECVAVFVAEVFVAHLPVSVAPGGEEMALPTARMGVVGEKCVSTFRGRLSRHEFCQHLSVHRIPGGKW